jgi:NAD(P)H-nitrite reductase large subunit
VVGGGILGIEAALRALDAGMDVTIVQLMDRLMPAQFGARASAVLLRRLQDRRIRVLLGHEIKSVAGDDRTARLTLDDGQVLEAELCLVSIGARPETGLSDLAGLDADRGITVDYYLQTTAAACFAAGDAIQIEGVTRCSMKEATTQGKVAATNLVAYLQGRSLHPYQAETAPSSFRAKDFEIYSIGQPGGVGYEEHLLEGATESVIRALVVKDGIPLGVQMIGTREGFDDHAAAVKHSHAAKARFGHS